MNLPKFSLQHKSVVLLGAFILAAYGVYIFLTAPRKEDPSFNVRDAWIITVWLGATAEEVERFVTDPIEMQMAGIKFMRKMDSTSYPSVSVIQITTVDSIYDVSAAWDKVRRELKLVESELPPGVMSPYLNDHASQASVMMLCMYQDPDFAKERAYEPREMEEFAKRLRDRVMDLRPLQQEAQGDNPAVPNPSLAAYVERLDMYGVQEEAIYIETDLGKWSQLDLSAPQLTALLQARNLVVPGGTIDTPTAKFNVQATGSLNAVRQIEGVTVARVTTAAGGQKLRQPLAMVTQEAVGIQQSTGETLGPLSAPLSQNVPVRLKDLDLKVTRGYRDPTKSLVRFSDTRQSSPSIALAFTMKPGVNIVDLDKALANLLDEAPKTFLPPDIKIAKVSNQPVAVEKKVNEVVGNVVSSIVVVIIVLVLMAGLRTATIATIAIPTIMLMAIGMMRLWDIEIEQVSLAALIVALGVLVDNTIQVSNNTQAFLDKGRPPQAAAVEGPNQIGFSTFIATCTIIAAFYPMTFCLEGAMREYAFSLPMVMCLCLAIGWIFAMTVTCILSAKMLKPGGDINPLIMLKKHLPGKKSVTSTKSTNDSKGSPYFNLAMLAIRAKWITVVGSYAFLALMLMLPVPSSFFPKSDRNQFVVDVLLPESATIEQTNEVQAHLERMIRALHTKAYDENGKLVDLPESEQRLLNMGSLVGVGGPYNFAGLFPKADGSNYGVIWVNSVTGPQVPQFIEDIRRAASEGIGEPGAADYIPPITGARIVPQQLVTGTPVLSPIDIRIVGPRMGDDRVLRKYAARVKQALRDSGMAWDIHDSWGELGRQLDVEVDQEKANLAGVTNASILLSMNAYYSGHPLTQYREGDKQISIMLRLPPEQRGTLDDLDAVFVQGLTAKVPLNSIANIERRWVNARINRYQRERNLSVRARPDGNLLFSQVLEEIQPQLDEIQADLPPGYRIEQGGTQEEADKGMRQIMGSLAISGVCIFFLLVIQFNSVVKPFMILLTIPLSAGGGLLGLYVMGVPMGFMEAVGMLALFGIVLSAAILLIEFSEILIKDKLSRGEGLAEEGEKSCCGLKRDVFRSCLASAGQLRLMPILMTTLTTVGGLLSLMLAGGPLFKGLATVIVFGLSIGTAFTLFFLPAIYAVFVENFGMTIKADEPSES